MKRVLGATDTAGIVFRGTGGESLIVVDHITGGNLTIEAHEPKDNFTSFLAIPTWSSDSAISATELGAFPSERVTVTDPTDELFDVEIPETTGNSNQYQAFGVPQHKTIRSIISNVGTELLSTFAVQAATRTIDNIVYQIWVTSSAHPITRGGSVWQLRVTDDDHWLNITQSAIGAANISADGQYSLKTSPEVEYRITPAAAGSTAWLVEAGYRLNV